MLGSNACSTRRQVWMAAKLKATSRRSERQLVGVLQGWPNERVCSAEQALSERHLSPEGARLPDRPSQEGGRQRLLSRN